MLNLEHITLNINDGEAERRLLDDVCLQVNDGEVVGLTGPSGSGKSTLLAVAAGLQKPSSGTATLNSTVDLINGGSSVRREHVGIVFQQPNLLPSLTAMQQLMVMARLDHAWGVRKKAWKSKETQARELLDKVGLADKANSRVDQLSGGQQARVNLARALMNDPDLLLIDEPTAALDTDNARAVTDLIIDLARERGIPVLYVSHDQQQLARLDRLVTMVDGRV